MMYDIGDEIVFKGQEYMVLGKGKKNNTDGNEAVYLVLEKLSDGSMIELFQSELEADKGSYEIAGEIENKEPVKEEKPKVEPIKKEAKPVAAKKPTATKNEKKVIDKKLVQAKSEVKNDNKAEYNGLYGNEEKVEEIKKESTPKEKNKTTTMPKAETIEIVYEYEDESGIIDSVGFLPSSELLISRKVKTAFPKRTRNVKNNDVKETIIDKELPIGKPVEVKEHVLYVAPTDPIIQKHELDSYQDKAENIVIPSHSIEQWEDVTKPVEVKEHVLYVAPKEVVVSKHEIKNYEEEKTQPVTPKWFTEEFKYENEYKNIKNNNSSIQTPSKKTVYDALAYNKNQRKIITNEIRNTPYKLHDSLLDPKEVNLDTIYKIGIVDYVPTDESNNNLGKELKNETIKDLPLVEETPVVIIDQPVESTTPEWFTKEIPSENAYKDLKDDSLKVTLAPKNVIDKAFKYNKNQRKIITTEIRNTPFKLKPGSKYEKEINLNSINKIGVIEFEPTFNCDDNVSLNNINKNEIESELNKDFNTIPNIEATKKESWYDRIVKFRFNK